MLFGSTVLEVAIGIIFIYLLLSLICSAANEFMATNTKRRAWMLEQGIRNLLLDENLDQKLSGNAMTQRRIVLNDDAAADKKGGASGAETKTDDASVSLSDIFYVHPLIKSLYHPRWFGISAKRPAYIPARTFALTILDIFTPEKSGQSKTIADVRAAIERLPAASSVRQSLLALVDEAEGDMEKLRINVEDWFNTSMDRVSDWYKRRTQRIIFFLGIVIVSALNADTIMMLKVLYTEPAVRAAVLAQAGEYAKKEAVQSDATGEVPKDAQDKLVARIDDYSDLGIPIGWNTRGGQVPRKPTASFIGAEQNRILFIRQWLIKIVGLLLTAFAISLGAPFWFDLLNRFISFRTAVKPPEATPERRERSMSLTTPPRPPNEPGHSALPIEKVTVEEEKNSS